MQQLQSHFKLTVDCRTPGEESVLLPAALRQATIMKNAPQHWLIVSSPPHHLFMEQPIRGLVVMSSSNMTRWWRWCHMTDNNLEFRSKLNQHFIYLLLLLLMMMTTMVMTMMMMMMMMMMMIMMLLLLMMMMMTIMMLLLLMMMMPPDVYNKTHIISLCFIPVCSDASSQSTSFIKQSLTVTELLTLHCNYRTDDTERKRIDSRQCWLMTCQRMMTCQWVLMLCCWQREISLVTSFWRTSALILLICRTSSWFTFSSRL